MSVVVVAFRVERIVAMLDGPHQTSTIPSPSLSFLFRPGLLPTVQGAGMTLSNA